MLFFFKEEKWSAQGHLLQSSLNTEHNNPNLANAVKVKHILKHSKNIIP